MINALAYNEDPLGVVVNLFNQLEPGGVLLTNLYIPTKKETKDRDGKITGEDYPEGDDLAEFYRRLEGHLRALGVDVDFRIEDFRKMTKGQKNSQGEEGPFKEYSVGILLRKKADQQLELLQRPSRVEEVTIDNPTVRLVTYKVAFYGEDAGQVIGLQTPAAGLEETPEIRTYADIEAMHKAELAKSGVSEAIRNAVTGQPNPKEIPMFAVFGFSGKLGVHADTIHFWLRQNGYSLDTSRNPAVWRNGDSKSRLEIQIKTVEDLAQMRGDQSARTLAVRLARAGKKGVALLPRAKVDAWELSDNAHPQVEIYAHPSVAEWIPYWLPSGWGLAKLTQLLKDDIAEANAQLLRAKKAVEADRTTVIVAIDKTRKEGLELPRAVVMLLDPNTIGGIHSGTMAAFLSQAAHLTNVILDLTSGSIRTVTIGGTEYYALDIAA